MLDDLGDVTPAVMTKEMKKKSLSTKNLSMGIATETSSGRRMAPSSSSSGGGDVERTAERITTV